MQVAESLPSHGSRDLTQTDLLGDVRGTLPYMSPERLAGGSAGPADDIFTLGAVLYEMLAGQRAFDGPTDAAILGTILHGRPQWDVLRTSGVPSSLTQLIRDCVNKRAADRPSAKEVAQRLRRVSTQTPASDSTAELKVPILTLGLLPFVGIDQQDGFTVLNVLETELRRLGNLRIVRAANKLDAADNESSVSALARDLRANLLMLGVVDQSDDRRVFRTRIVDPLARRQLYARTFVEGDSSYVACAQSLARTLVPELANLLHRPARSVRRRTPSPRAHELYIEGRYHWNKRTRQGNEGAHQCFMRAIEEDCVWALPHAGLADCHVLNAVAGWGDAAANYDQARTAANTAIGLDARTAEPHATLASVYWLADWNWRAAENEFQTALSLNPGYCEAYMWYGRHHSLRGHHDEAIKNLTLAWKLDPLSKAVSLAIGVAWYAAREFKIASAHLDQIVEQNPSWCNALYFAGLSHLMLGHTDTAIETLRRATSADRSTRRPLVGLAQAYWIAGDDTAARTVFNELIASDSRRYLSPCDVAEVLSVFGDRQGCIKWLRNAVDERCADLAGLRMDPMFDGMRTTDEFMRIESLVFGDA
jgi:serine/threonine-protein kinase